MPKELSRNERIKEASRYLRGGLAEGLAQEITGAIAEEDQQLVKFHGMYLQDDRDLRAERCAHRAQPDFVGRAEMEKFDFGAGENILGHQFAVIAAR
jgi:sulfite reductase (NADPH) hemoprotein beta-component